MPWLLGSCSRSKLVKTRPIFTLAVSSEAACSALDRLGDLHAPSLKTGTDVQVARSYYEPVFRRAHGAGLGVWENFRYGLNGDQDHARTFSDSRLSKRNCIDLEKELVAEHIP